MASHPLWQDHTLVQVIISSVRDNYKFAKSLSSFPVRAHKVRRLPEQPPPGRDGAGARAEGDRELKRRLAGRAGTQEEPHAEKEEPDQPFRHQKKSNVNLEEKKSLSIKGKRKPQKKKKYLWCAAVRAEEKSFFFPSMQ